MKKAQIQGQVFIYVLTLIITGMILIYGYNAITGISKKAEQVELVTFKTTIKSDFEKMSSDYGSVKTVSYNVPSKIDEICFYQEDISEPENPSENININNPLIRDSIKDTDNNVFLVMGDVIEPMELSRIEVGDGQILCIPVSNNKLNLRLKGLGDGVLVE